MSHDHFLICLIFMESAFTMLPLPDTQIYHANSTAYLLSVYIKVSIYMEIPVAGQPIEANIWC